MAFLHGQRFGYPETTQKELFRESMKKYGKDTPAYYDGLDALKVTKVSHARETEDCYQLPKYSHVALGVIHPSPVKRMTKPTRPDPDFEAEGSPERIRVRPLGKPEIPESLQRPPGFDRGGVMSA